MKHARGLLRPRWQTGLLTLSMPLWLLPVMLYVGWTKAGRYAIREFLPGLAWAFLGREPRR